MKYMHLLKVKTTDTVLCSNTERSTLITISAIQMNTKGYVKNPLNPHFMNEIKEVGDLVPSIEIS